MLITPWMIISPNNLEKKHKSHNINNNLSNILNLYINKVSISLQKFHRKVRALSITTTTILKYRFLNIHRIIFHKSVRHKNYNLIKLYIDKLTILTTCLKNLYLFVSNSWLKIKISFFLFLIYFTTTIISF